MTTPIPHDTSAEAVAEQEDGVPADLTAYLARLAGLRFRAGSPLEVFLARAFLSVNAAALAVVLLMFTRFGMSPFVLILCPLFMVFVYAMMPIVACEAWRKAMRRIRWTGVVSELRLTAYSIDELNAQLERICIAKGYGWFAGVAAFPAFVAVFATFAHILPSQPTLQDQLLTLGLVALLLGATGSCVWIHAIWGHQVMRRRTIPMLLQPLGARRLAGLLFFAFFVGAVPTAAILAGMLVAATIFTSIPGGVPEVLGLVVMFGMFPAVELVAWALTSAVLYRAPEVAIVVDDG